MKVQQISACSPKQCFAKESVIPNGWWFGTIRGFGRDGTPEVLLFKTDSTIIFFREGFNPSINKVDDCGSGVELRHLPVEPQLTFTLEKF